MSEFIFMVLDTCWTLEQVLLAGLCDGALYLPPEVLFTISRGSASGEAEGYVPRKSERGVESQAK